MRRIIPLILALSLFLVSPAFAAGYDGGYATVNSSSSGSGATACAGLSDASAFCNSAAASALTGPLPAISGASLTNLNPAALSTPVPAAQGGTATTYGAPACTNGGTIANTGTVTPNFTGTNCYTFTVVSGGSFTYANPTNLPTNAVVYISFNQAATGFPGQTWGNKYFAYSTSSQKWLNDTTVLTGANFYANATTGFATSAWWSDGTNLFALPGGNISPQFDAVKVRLLTATSTSTMAAINSSGLLNIQAVVVASLPATCVKNSIITVTDATSFTAGACVGSGSNSTIAICSATNTWTCL